MLRPSWDDYTSQERFQEADQAYFESEALKQFNREKRTYVLKFDTDGSFRVDDVLPGSYRLVVRVLDPSDDPRAFPDSQFWPELGAVRQDVIVPEITGGRSDESLNIGTFEMTLSKSASASRTKRNVR